MRERIKKLMRYQDITQAELAEKTGITATSISRYLNNARTLNVESIIKIAEVLNTTPDYLLGVDKQESKLYKKNGESKLAGKAAFNSDFNFNLYEYFHFCSKMLKKDDTKPISRGRSSNSPCMIVFCAFEQIQTLILAAKKHGFVNYIPLVFCKNYSPQVLKANMRVVGATEYALVLYRNKLPKFRNGCKQDENGKNIPGTGHMVFNWFEWERDGKDIPKIHPAQKPVKVLKQLIEIFTDPGDVVIDPCAGSGSTLRAAAELGRSAFGFEIDRNFYTRAKNEMLVFPKDNQLSFFDDGLLEKIV